MKLPRLALDNYQFSLVLVFLVSFLGIISYYIMPKAEDPFMNYAASSVLVINPGCSPEDMETLVANPLEEAINEIEGIKIIDTKILNGLVSMFIEMEYGLDYAEVHREVVQKVNEKRDELPESIIRLDVVQPSILDVNILQMAVTSKTASSHDLKVRADDLKDELEKCPGVRAVNVDGERELELQVKCNMERLAQYNLSVSQVLKVMQSINQSIPAGSIDVGKKNFNVLTSGLYKDIEAIENTIVNSGEGMIVKLKDVATLTYDYKRDESIARYNGQPAVWVSVQQKKDKNIYQVTEQLEIAIEKFRKELPSNISVATVSKQSVGVKTRINQFVMSFIQGIFLVGIIVLLAVGYRASIVVMLAIPISVLSAIGFLDLSGFGLQQMSIAGLIIALGMLVDNGIAIVENIYRFMLKGFSAREAAIKGASEIGIAIVSSTITTLLAFAPMLMMGNDVGDFIQSMILIVIYALLASLIVALCVTPYLSSIFLKKPKAKTKKSILNRFSEGTYIKWVSQALANPKKTIITALIVFIASISLLPLIGVSFFPKADKNQLIINVLPPEGSNLECTNQAVKHVEEIIRKSDNIDIIASTIGEGNPNLYYNMEQHFPEINYAQVLCTLKEYDSEKMGALIKHLREEFTDYHLARLEIKEFIQGPPVNAPVEIRLFCDNLTDLKKMAVDVEEIFRKVPSLININNPLSADKTDLKVKVNFEKAGLLGVNVIDIDLAVRAELSGLTIGKYQDAQGKDYSLVIISETADSSEVARLERIFVPSMLGGQVRLSQVADVIFEKNIKRIEHYDLDRFITLSADVNEDLASISEATKRLLKALNHYQLPQGASFQIGGEQESRNESFGGLGQSLLIALFGIFAVLVLQFRSFKQPLIIFSAIPLSITGAFLALFITNYSFSFMAFVGLTSLMGIVINSSIILVDYANQLLKKNYSVQEAVLEAAKTRFTPIILTTVTTIAGLIPLTFGGGDMWAPMGWAIIGGLIISTLLTLILVPVLYKIFTQQT